MIAKREDLLLTSGTVDQGNLVRGKASGQLGRHGYIPTHPLRCSSSPHKLHGRYQDELAELLKIITQLVSLNVLYSQS